MSIRTLSIALLVVTACTERPLGDTEASAGGPTTETTGAPATTLPDASGSTSAEPTTGAPDPVTSTTAAPDPGTTGDPPSDFITPPDGGPHDGCDQWQQDCPEGQKCMPWSADGDNWWESLKCVDVVPDPDDVGEPCMVFGAPASGEDTCDLGQMCWNVVDGVGTCVALCVGSPDVPTCADPQSTCTLGGESVLALCLPNCDPLKQDCPGNDLCLPNPNDPANFLCVLDASGEEGQAFDPCEYMNACDPGLICVGPEFAGECDPAALGCCLPYCDNTLEPTDCPGQGLQCLPWFDLGTAPPDLEKLGLCGLPQP
ncbi:hypothetical protein [Nannocystis pusilla]|uniref:hypothetical protein n=1 Tax=Nannocystis pusilla TaxID=889268 RepID=UPI003DA292DE